MPAPAPVAPRQMLQPPTTMAISVSSSRRASASSIAIRSTIAPSMVSSLAELANASPETFRTTRFHGCVGGVVTPPSCAEMYRNPLNSRVSVHPGTGLGSRADTDLSEADDLGVAEHLLDALLVVLGVALLEQHALLVPAVELALDDLRKRLVGLARVAGL